MHLLVLGLVTVVLVDDVVEEGGEVELAEEGPLVLEGLLAYGHKHIVAKFDLLAHRQQFKLKDLALCDAGNRRGRCLLKSRSLRRL